MTEGISFEELRVVNFIRCNRDFHPIDEWSETDWMCAVAGEVGEATNLVKKRRRPQPIPRDDVIDELADAVIYIDLLCTRMGARLEDGIRRKFEAVSERIGSDVHFNGYKGG